MDANLPRPLHHQGQLTEVTAGPEQLELHATALGGSLPADDHVHGAVAVALLYDHFAALGSLLLEAGGEHVVLLLAE